MCGLWLCMHPVFHTGHYVVLVSSFCILKALFALKRKGVFAAALFQYRYWPTYVSGQHVSEYFQEKAVVTFDTISGDLESIKYTISGYSHFCEWLSICSHMKITSISTMLQMTTKTYDPQFQALREYGTKIIGPVVYFPFSLQSPNQHLPYTRAQYFQDQQHSFKIIFGCELAWEILGDKFQER